jgi:hypothetical protein
VYEITERFLLTNLHNTFFLSVVALFNAITKTKKDEAEKAAAEKSKDKSEGWCTFIK